VDAVERRLAAGELSCPSCSGVLAAGVETARDGVVRLAERLDDTVGLSAFRSKYADVVVCSGCVSGSGDLPPGGEAVGHHLSVLVRGQQVSAWPEVRGYRAEHGEEPLRVGV
jgi:hypothetical protein